jgi:hypothetical protein
VPAPTFLLDILGLRAGIPNSADIASVQSIAIALEVHRILGVTRTVAAKFDAGRALEVGVKDYLAAELPRLDPTRAWDIDRRHLVTHFQQYEHLARLDALVVADPTLRTEIGRDYLIAPDVTVGVPSTAGGATVLHAAISCKWTIRSDRVQNIRHEGVILTRSRRGRQPHIVTVTAEPLPSRLAAIARGTGEVDTVYHVALDELSTATASIGNAEQQAVLAELITQRRLADFHSLVEILATS